MSQKKNVISAIFLVIIGIGIGYILFGILELGRGQSLSFPEIPESSKRSEEKIDSLMNVIKVYEEIRDSIKRDVKVIYKEKIIELERYQELATPDKIEWLKEKLDYYEEELK